jgi:hypothetical protein
LTDFSGEYLLNTGRMSLMDAATRHNDHLPAIWNLRESKLDRFIDSGNSLETIHETLADNPICIIESPDSASGFHGSTTFAREYAYAYAEDYQAIWWMHGESEAAMALEYTELAVALDMMSDHAVIEKFKTIEEIKSRLSEHTGWLLIFDDVPDPAMIEALLPNPVDGHVLITTSHPTDTGHGNV